MCPLYMLGGGGKGGGGGGDKWERGGFRAPRQVQEEEKKEGVFVLLGKRDSRKILVIFMPESAGNETKGHRKGFQGSGAQTDKSTFGPRDGEQQRHQKA